MHVWGGSPLTQKFCEKLFALRPLLFRLTVRSPVVASRRPDSAANYVYIDAVRGSSVTRRTLLSYLRKSCCVNGLIVGKLWETRERLNGAQAVQVRRRYK